MSIQISVKRDLDVPGPGVEPTRTVITFLVVSCHKSLSATLQARNDGVGRYPSYF